MSIKNWRACPGVNRRTGRVKKGYRAIRGNCPVRAATHLVPSSVEMVSIASILPGLSGARRRS